MPIPSNIMLMAIKKRSNIIAIITLVFEAVISVMKLNTKDKHKVTIVIFIAQILFLRVDDLCFFEPLDLSEEFFSPPFELLLFSGLIYIFAIYIFKTFGGVKLAS